MSKKDPYDWSAFKGYELQEAEAMKMPVAMRLPHTIGIQLLTVYKADPASWSLEQYEKIIARAELILKANDWMMSSLELKDPSNFKLVCKPEKMVPANFIQEEVIDPRVFKLDGEMTYKEKCGFIGDFRVGLAMDAYEKGLPLAKFYILRDHESILEAKHIGIITSINHLIADGSTLYNTNKMFDMHSEVRTLNRNSVHHYHEELENKTGLALKKRTENALDVFASMQALALMVKTLGRGLSGKKKWKQLPFCRCYRINESEVAKIKSQHNTSDFWVSTNDILTHKILTKNPNCNLGFILVDMRLRLECLSEDLVGNYLTGLILHEEDLKSIVTMRQCLNKKLPKKGSGGNVEKIENFKSDPQKLPGIFTLVKGYAGGLTTNWATFYAPVRLEGLEMEYQLPVIDNRLDKKPVVFGTPMAKEEGAILFKYNDHEHGVFVMSGSGTLEPEDFDKDPIFNGLFI